MTRVGETPKMNNNKNRYGQQYSRNWLAYESKKVKALAKAHLFFHSLKPKVKQIQDYIQANPTAEDAEQYSDMLNTYFNMLAYVTKELKKRKNSLAFNQNIIDMANLAKRHHNEINVPIAKIMLKQLNKEEAEYAAQRKLYNKFQELEKQAAEKAELQLKEQYEKEGLNYHSSLTVNKNAENLRMKIDKDYKEAMANERKRLQNIITNTYRPTFYTSFTRKNTNRRRNKRTRKM